MGNVTELDFHTLIGKRIELRRMGEDPDPIPVGSVGLVETVTRWPDGSYQLGVRWEGIGRRLGVICPPDEVRVLE